MAVTETRVIDGGEVLDPPFSDTFDKWLAARNSADAAAPPLRAFPLDALDTRLLPWAVVVDVLRDEGNDAPRDFRYRFWGTERSELIGAEMTGRNLSDIENAYMREANRNEYEEILRRCAPLLCETPVVTASGRRTSFQSLRLPLSNDGRTVDNVFSAFNYLRIAAPHYEYFGTEPPLRVR